MSPDIEHFDVLIVGAGISGIGAARYLKTEHPAKTFTILEARGATGGTWDLFRYPGIRSDSDLYTFGYAFKPWTDEDSIASAEKILAYVREVSAENGIDEHIRFHHRVRAASWSSEDARWLIEAEDARTGERREFTAGWFFCATGYYSYDQGFSPRFEGRERFTGPVVHPQHWPDDLDHAGKRVVVIGSGATAVTIIPAMAETAAHVTMVQRTPTYILPLPTQDPLAGVLRRLLGEERSYGIVRRKNVAMQRWSWLFCRRFPKAARRMIRSINARRLPEGFPVDEHFNPPYDPWDQRLCIAPDGDLFQAIRHGRASVVTGHIEAFTPEGVRMESGEHLDADVIVTATGLDLKLFGGVGLAVDGEPVDPGERFAYKGMMLSGVPNFVLAIGYTNASWTLKVGLVCEYFCKLLAHMDAHGYDTARPVADPGLPKRPLLDFQAGYVLRSLDKLPKQGPVAPWAASTHYRSDRRLVRRGGVADGHLRFSSAESSAAGRVPSERP
ncbi:MAG: FAD-dependent oxidoreductase [Streptosporangiales bacterium]|nr:FAD-dependent oxidoreductase [Streptosporangiales bacterium]